MELRLDYIRKLTRKRNWSGSELARQMGVSRSEANRLLNGDRKSGNKIITGLLTAFPNETFGTLFILPELSPNVNDYGSCVCNEVRTQSIPVPRNIAGKLKPVRHPSAHHLDCDISDIMEMRP